VQDWTKLIEEHGSVLLLFARQWVQSHADAEEAVQDGFVRVWRSRHRDADKILPLLYRAVKFAAIDRARGRLRRQKREQSVYEDGEGEVARFQCDLDWEVRERRIEDALQRIPVEQREVIVMKIWGDMTFRDIGESLGIPQNTAASRYRYALGALRDQLGEEFKDE